MNKDDYITSEVINDIEHCLVNNKTLSKYQKGCIMYALNKVRDVKQVPYYEVVYHDEYDRTERRIMEPISMNIIDDGHVRVRKDRFEVNFNRLLP